MDIKEVKGFICPECDGFFDGSGGAVYECSRCGGRQVEERRCEQDNIFMAKVADESCPECESPIEEELPEEDMFETPDGQHHTSRAEAEEWIAAEPEREKQRAESKARTEKMMDEMRLKSIKEGIEVLPILRKLHEMMPPQAEKIGKRVARELQELERELAREDERRFVSSMWLTIDVEELTLLLFPGPDTEDLVSEANDYSAEDWRRRRAIQEDFRNRTREVLAEMFGEENEWDRGTLDLGSAFLSEAKTAAPMLIAVIERWRVEINA